MRKLILGIVLVLSTGTQLFLQAQTTAPPPAIAPPGAAAPQPHAGMDMPGMKHDPNSMDGMAMGGTQHEHGSAVTIGESTMPRWTDAEWSIFNHRMSGWFLFFWGLTALIAGLQWPRQTSWRFVPPFALFAMVEFLLFRNDPEAWPIGPVGFWRSLKDPEVLQHRVFLTLLLVMAINELLRAAGRLPPLLQKYSLPTLSVFGGIYLFFHKHGGAAMAKMTENMSDPAIAGSPAMQSMMHSMRMIRHEHLWFSLIGFGLAAAKFLGDAGHLKGRLGASLWTVFAIILGLYMAVYTE